MAKKRDIKKPTDTSELRGFLLDNMVKVARGELGAEPMRAITNGAQQVYNTLNIEAKFAIVKDKIGEGKIGSVKFKR